MIKSKIIISVVAVALIATLFYLPKIVVENDTSDLNSTQQSTTSSANNPESGDSHENAIPQEVLVTIEHLREKLNNSTDKKKNTIFADSLSVLFKEYQRFDSSAYYAEILATVDPSNLNKERAGEAYYKAFSFTANGELRVYFAQKANMFFNELIATNPERLDLVANNAMTKVVLTNPMEGVMELRTVLEKDPQNETALFNLGLLSMQSGQFDKAIERFESLLAINQQHKDAKLYLSISQYELGEYVDAKKNFEELKILEDDPLRIQTIDGYLKELE